MTAGKGFLPLFALEMVHEYFNGGAYGSFTLVPLGATEKVLQRFGWAGAQTDNKFTLFADPKRMADCLKQGAEVPPNTPDLCYAITFRDPDFARYSALPVRQGCVLAFAARSGTQKRPHLSVKATLSPADLTPVQTRVFQCSVAEGAAAGDLCIARPSGEKVMPLPAPRGGKVTVDPSALDLGLYHVLNQKKIIYRFIKSDNAPPVWSDFVLSISVQQMVSVFQRHSLHVTSSARKPAGGAVGSHLTLPARATIWRYDFLNHQGAEARDFEILPAEAARASTLPAFRPVKGLKGLSGETSISFESAKPIPLSARPPQRLKLMRKKHTLIAELPTPGLDFTAPPGASALRSSLFIYL